MATSPVPAAPAVRLFKAEVGAHELLVPEERAWAFPGGRYYEHNVTAWIERMLAATHAPTLYDLGSNIGFYAVHGADRAAAVYAFEPVSSTYAILDQNVRRNDLANVRTFQAGVSDEDGTAVIHLFSSSGSNTVYDRDMGLASAGQELIELVRLDAFA